MSAIDAATSVIDFSFIPNVWSSTASPRHSFNRAESDYSQPRQSKRSRDDGRVTASPFTPPTTPGGFSSPSLLASPWSRLSEALPSLPSPVRQPTPILCGIRQSATPVSPDINHCFQMMTDSEPPYAIWDRFMGQKLPAGFPGADESVCDSIRLGGSAGYSPLLSPEPKPAGVIYIASDISSPVQEETGSRQPSGSDADACENGWSPDFCSLLAISPLRLPSQDSVDECDVFVEFLGNPESRWSPKDESDSSTESPRQPLPYLNHVNRESLDWYEEEEWSDEEGSSDSPSHCSCSTSADGAAPPGQTNYGALSDRPPRTKKLKLSSVAPTAVRMEGVLGINLHSQTSETVAISTSKARSTTGCKCKKLRCINSLCDCVKGGRSCGEACRCQGCENSKGGSCSTGVDPTRAAHGGGNSRGVMSAVVSQCSKVSMAKTSNCRVSGTNQSSAVQNSNQPSPSEARQQVKDGGGKKTRPLAATKDKRTLIAELNNNNNKSSTGGNVLRWAGPAAPMWTGFPGCFIQPSRTLQPHLRFINENRTQPSVATTPPTPGDGQAEGNSTWRGGGSSNANENNNLSWNQTSKTFRLPTFSLPARRPVPPATAYCESLLESKAKATAIDCQPV